MLKLLSIIILYNLAAEVESICLETNWCNEIIGCVNLTVNCSIDFGYHPYSRENINTKFYLQKELSSRVYMKHRLIVDDWTTFQNSTFNAENPTKFLVHGYLDSADTLWMENMAKALHTYSDFNVIRVDWSGGSRALYPQSVANTHVVGLEISHFMKKLQEYFNISSTSFHCIGHSLGSHICGFSGKLVTDLGRITGLDPAGPLFNNAPTNLRLSPSDANFVDAIHTDAKGFGILEPVGKIDIYPNSGIFQPQCDLSRLINLSAADYLINLVACNHILVTDYFIETLLEPNCQWVAYQCSSYEHFKQGKCNSCGDDNSKCAFLGIRADEYVDYSAEERIFFIDTAGEKPYCIAHYAINISSPTTEMESRPKGNLIVQIYGTKGNFTARIQIKTDDDESFISKLLTSRTDVGEIRNISLTYVSDLSLLNLISLNPTLLIESIKVSPLSHYPEGEREKLDVVACAPEGSVVELESQETVSFFVQNTTCPELL